MEEFDSFNKSRERERRIDFDVIIVLLRSDAKRFHNLAYQQ